MHFPKRRRPAAREEAGKKPSGGCAPFIGGGAPVNRGRRFSKTGRPCYEAAMGQDRVEQAIGRIERALGRIEAAAGRASASSASADSALGEAHEALRGRVREALAQLDGLIEAAEAR